MKGAYWGFLLLGGAFLIPLDGTDWWYGLGSNMSALVAGIISRDR